MKTSIFSPEALDKIVNETIPSTPNATDFHSYVVGGIDQDGAQVVALLKFSDDKWEVSAAARHNWTGDNSVGAKVLLRF